MGPPQQGRRAGGLGVGGAGPSSVHGGGGGGGDMGGRPSSRGNPQGRAVQVHPMKTTLKPPGTERLKLKCDKLVSTSAFKFSMRRYTKGGAGAGPAFLKGAAEAGAGVAIPNQAGGWRPSGTAAPERHCYSAPGAGIRSRATRGLTGARFTSRPFPPSAGLTALFSSAHLEVISPWDYLSYHTYSTSKRFKCQAERNAYYV